MPPPTQSVARPLFTLSRFFIFVEQRCQISRARGPDGMAQRYRAAVDIHLFHVEPEIFSHCAKLCCKGLVCLTGRTSSENGTTAVRRLMSVLLEKGRVRRDGLGAISGKR